MKLFWRLIIIVFLCGSLSVITTQTQAQTATIPAFPGAEGFGANSVGGRGGQVIEVTNLNDAGPGSLRSCIDASGPRTCIFKVGGTITLNKSLLITNPFITIAGQTAPGGGITLRNSPSNTGATILIKTHDVILRYFRVRTGASQGLSCCVQSLTVTTGYNIIADHLSTSWSTDQTITFFTDPKTENIHDITLQWSIVSEALYKSTHQKGPHSMAALFGSANIGNISFHHNLLAHNNGRNPNVSLASGVLDVVNNVIYNYGQELSFANAANGSYAINYLGNFVKRGPSYATTNHFVKLGLSDPRIVSVYLKGNIDQYRYNNSLDDSHTMDPRYLSYIIPTRNTAPPVITYTCNSLTDCEAYNQVLAHSGANMMVDSQGNYIPRLDAVDKRIIEEVKRGEGRIIDATSLATKYNASASAYLSPSDYTKYGINDPIAEDGWPVLAAGTPTPDSDHDGMPDAWEDKYGLNKNDASDGNQDANGDGYTNLEEYLNGIVPTGTTCVGDIDENRLVDLRDYSLLVSNFFKTGTNITPAKADLNGDGTVNLMDYSLLVTRFLKSC